MEVLVSLGGHPGGGICPLDVLAGPRGSLGGREVLARGRIMNPYAPDNAGHRGLELRRIRLRRFGLGSGNVTITGGCS